MSCVSNLMPLFQVLRSLPAGKLRRPLCPMIGDIPKAPHERRILSRHPSTRHVPSRPYSRPTPSQSAQGGYQGADDVDQPLFELNGLGTHSATARHPQRRLRRATPNSSRFSGSSSTSWHSEVCAVETPPRLKHEIAATSQSQIPRPLSCARSAHRCPSFVFASDEPSFARLSNSLPTVHSRGVDALFSVSSVGMRVPGGAIQPMNDRPARTRRIFPDRPVNLSRAAMLGCGSILRRHPGR